MNPLAEAIFDERFERRLARDARMPPEFKRRRLARVDARAARGCRADIEPGDRFDTLEYPTDFPIRPDCGHGLPSQRRTQRFED